MTGSQYTGVDYKSPLILLTIKRELGKSEKAIEPDTCVFQEHLSPLGRTHMKGEPWVIWHSHESLLLQYAI